MAWASTGPIAEFLQEESATLVQAFNSALEAKKWHTNPPKETKRRKVPKRKSNHYLRADEVPRVMEALDPRFRPVFAVSVFLGLRRGEALGLKKEDVDLVRK